MIEDEFEKGDSVLYNDEVHSVVEVYHGWNGKVSSYGIRKAGDSHWHTQIVSPKDLSPCPIHRRVLESLDDEEDDDKYFGFYSTTTTYVNTIKGTRYP